MPVPLILGGLAIAAGAYGVKKGVDATSDYSEAKAVNNEAKKTQDTATSKLNKARERTNSAMEALGKQKFQVYETRLIPFKNAFERLHNVDFKEVDFDSRVAVDQADMSALKKTASSMQGVIAAGITSIGAGGLAGLAAYGSVGVLASTAGGTAIASLSGVAATNATLAWLGGGALSVGGYGMAGGTAVLGGIVAGPVLAVGGMMLAAKAESAKHDAYSNLALAKDNAEKMQTAQLKVKAIKTAFLETDQVLSKLDATFAPILEGLESLIAHSRKDWSGKIDFTALTEQDQIGVFLAAMLAKTMKNLVEYQILTEEGEVNGELGDILSTSQLVIKETTKKMDELAFEQRAVAYRETQQSQPEPV